MQQENHRASWIDKDVHIGYVLLVGIVILAAGCFLTYNVTSTQLLSRFLSHDEEVDAIMLNVSHDPELDKLNILYTAYVKLWAESAGIETTLPKLEAENLRAYKKAAMKVIVEEMKTTVSGRKAERVPNYIRDIIMMNGYDGRR